MLTGLAPAALAALPTVCAPGPLKGYVPSVAEIAAHRMFTLPTLRYPFGTRIPGRWGISLTLQVGASGQVLCYQLKDDRGNNQPLTDQRRALIAQIPGWRYTPFTQGKRKVKAVLSEPIYEEERPKEHIPLPEAPLQTLDIRLERGACYGDCPVYRIEISGDGQVVYRGEDFVDVLGEHRYQVPHAAVAALLQTLRSSDLWSMRPRYIDRSTDMAPATLTLRIDHEEHRIVDIGGQAVGMPAAVTAFEGQVDKAADTGMWISFSEAALQHLKTEHFRFHSRAGGDLLARTIDGAADEKAIVDLLSLGAPINDLLDWDSRLPDVEQPSLLDEALLNGMPAVTDALIARGALHHNLSGKVSQDQLDAAFQAAIRGGRLSLVQEVWALGDVGQHPSLTFRYPPGELFYKRYPVTLLLQRGHDQDYPWDGLQIAQWLAAKGCDLKAASFRGVTLLEIAVTANDPAFVRYLISRGVKDSGTGQGPTALESAQKEDIALALLQSGASVPPTREASMEFRAYAKSRHWTRVMSWLKAHTL